MVGAVMSTEIRQVQGFKVHVLRTGALELAVVPELGARIVSLKSRVTGREWMWHPDGGLKLFRNCLGDGFSRGTLAGADECLPTIAPCAWRGRDLPDHGEVWSVPWDLDPHAWSNGSIRTTVELAVSPLRFERTIRVEESCVRMDYVLTNRGAAEESFLWSMHPLLRLEQGDRLLLPAHTRELLDGQEWIDHLDNAVLPGDCAKIFARPLRQGRAEIHNETSGDRLLFEWNPAENATLGIWLTRGGWHGHHHFALEPTNGEPDALDEAAGRQHCGVISAFGSACWSISLKVEP